MLAINANLIRLLLYCTNILHIVRSPGMCLEKILCEHLNRKLVIQINILSVLWKRRFKVYKQRRVGLSWLMHDGTTVPWTSPCVSGIYKYEISYTVSGIL